MTGLFDRCTDLFKVFSRFLAMAAVIASAYMLEKQTVEMDTN